MKPLKITIRKIVSGIAIICFFAALIILIQRAYFWLKNGYWVSECIYDICSANFAGWWGNNLHNWVGAKKILLWMFSVDYVFVLLGVTFLCAFIHDYFIGGR